MIISFSRYAKKYKQTNVKTPLPHCIAVNSLGPKSLAGFIAYP